MNRGVDLAYVDSVLTIADTRHRVNQPETSFDLPTGQPAEKLI